jgi:predicted protein tyrosine phosphatase
MSGYPTKVLFVCSQNRIRSLTAERIFDGVAGFQVRSAGTQPDARIVITEGQIGWADVIFVMERSHLNRLRGKFFAALAGKRIIALHIPDEYQFMQPELIDELKARVGQHIDISGGNTGT